MFFACWGGIENLGGHLGLYFGLFYLSLHWELFHVFVQLQLQKLEMFHWDILCMEHNTKWYHSTEEYFHMGIYEMGLR